NVKLSEDIDFISGVVISDASSGNVPGNSFYIQEGRDGIAVDIEDKPSSISEKILQGNLVKINLTGSSIIKKAGNFTITGINSSDVEVLEEGKSVKPASLTLRDLANNFDSYNASLV